MRSASVFRPALLAPLLLLACRGSDAPAESARPQNLVVLVIDTLRPDHLGCYGYARPTSPALDRWARNATVFERAQSAAPWTAPALVSLMTGLYPEAHEVARFPDPARLADDVTTLAELLSARGYDTAAFTGGGYASGDFGLDQGFAHFERQTGDDESHASNLRYASRLEANVDKSLAWLREREGRPFFLFLHTYEPHVPYAPAQRWLDAVGAHVDLEREEAALADTIARWNAGARLTAEDWARLAAHRFHCGWEGAGAVQRRDALEEELALRDQARRASADEPMLRLVRDLYDAEIAAADAQFGRVLAELEALGLAQDTVVVLASDHGEAFGEHGELGHGLLLSDAVLRIALVVRAPHERARGGRCDELVSAVDLVPTLAELLDLGVPDAELPGRSLVPLLRGARGAAAAYAQANSAPDEHARFRSVREGRWRLVAQVNGPRRWLYDLERDPGEEHDLAASQPVEVARLEALLEERAARDEATRRRHPAGAAPALHDARDLRALGYVGGDAPGTSEGAPH
ncbi:MAG: sulfatase [Planctomycetes bacterium]|nr:sulfatase [Planctomycetota bacterium]